MKMLTLNRKSKETIEKKVGCSFDELVRSDVDLLDNAIEKKIGKKLKHQFKVGNYVARGSVYLFLKRLVDQNEIDRFLSKI